MWENVKLIKTYQKERTTTRRSVLWIGLPCDLKCVCYERWNESSPKEWMPLDDIKQALNKYRYFYKNESVDFMGGEPTLHPQILDIINYASSIGLRPSIITNAMHLTDKNQVTNYLKSGIYDFLLSIHAVGPLADTLHGCGKDNFTRQMQAIDNLNSIGIPFRMNCIIIRNNLTQLYQIAELAVQKKARVLNFLTFNPHFEWNDSRQIEFLVRHSEALTFLTPAIEYCIANGLEVNIRYMPICLFKNKERFISTGFQLSYDPHEWDFNSWYDYGLPGIQAATWYNEIASEQRIRHEYVHTQKCMTCSMVNICDGLHSKYLLQWGDDELNPYCGEPINNPQHFIQHQAKYDYITNDTADFSFQESAPSFLTNESLELPLLGRAKGGFHPPLIKP
jgi:MoaA/NifB/PqqE/SkfB family radical SAM enzyme